MKKVVQISFKEPNQLICTFNSGEVKLLDLSFTLNDKYGRKILSDESILKNAQVGDWGEIYWQKMAEITNLSGEKEVCNYDISPEFAYANSELLIESVHSNKHDSDT